MEFREEKEGLREINRMRWSYFIASLIILINRSVINEPSVAEHVTIPWTIMISILFVEITDSGDVLLIIY